jgi:Photosynthesis system II assembly factor YCF48/Putative zinc-finger
MTGLPKIVRDRLGRAPGGATARDHPDANLLAGYVERSLTSRERSVVLGHLAQCAECREQVSAALPNLEAQMAPRGTGVGRGWLRWPALRWGLLVTSLVIMGTVALVRQPPARHMELASRANVAPPRPAALPSDVTVGAAPGKAAKPVNGPSQDTTLLKGKSQNDELALSLKSELSAALPNRKQAAEAQLKKEAQSYQAAQAEAFRTSPNVINGGRSNQPSTNIVGQAAPPPAAPTAATPNRGQRAEQSLDSLASPQSQVETSRSSEEDKRMSAGEAGRGRVQEPPPPKASSPTPDNFAATPRPQATLGRPSPLAASPATSNALVSSLPTADWTISAAGKVQRSRDGRKSWEELDVDKNVVFRVVFAVGPDVWLGGSKGALYHSADGGQHWTRVNIGTGSTTVTDDVIHIEFKDAQHGIVGTAAGDSWATTDAGQHWQKQR